MKGLFATLVIIVSLVVVVFVAYLVFRSPVIKCEVKSNVVSSGNFQVAKISGRTLVQFGKSISTSVQRTHQSSGQTTQNLGGQSVEIENPHAKSDGDDHGKGKGDKK